MMISFLDEEFYSGLKSYVLSKEQLRENSYPITEAGQSVVIHKNGDLEKLKLSSKGTFDLNVYGYYLLSF